MPMRKIKVHTPEGEVMYEGPGELEFRGNLVQTATLRIERDGYRCSVELDELMRYGPYHFTVCYEPPEFLDGDASLPEVSRWDLELSIPPALARSLREEIDRSHPVSSPFVRLTSIRGVRDGYGVAPRAEFTADMAHGAANRLRDEHARNRNLGVEPNIEEFRNAFAQAQISMGEFRTRMEMDIRPDPAHDELITSTRAEFPPDLYEYGRINPEGPSRWTPPDDPDEKVSRCPA